MFWYQGLAPKCLFLPWVHHLGIRPVSYTGESPLLTIPWLSSLLSYLSHMFIICFFCAFHHGFSPFTTKEPLIGALKTLLVTCGLKVKTHNLDQFLGGGCHIVRLDISGEHVEPWLPGFGFSSLPVSMRYSLGLSLLCSLSPSFLQSSPVLRILPRGSNGFLQQTLPGSG